MNDYDDEQPTQSYAELSDDELAEFYEVEMRRGKATDDIEQGDIVQGYIAKITFNPTWAAFSYALFLQRDDAELYAKRQLAYEESITKQKGYAKVEQTKVRACSCGRLIDVNGYDDCLFCEDMRADAQYDYADEVSDDDADLE